MANHDITEDIARILDDPQLARSGKVARLKQMREDTRADMRAASESAMVDDAETGDELKHLDEALDKLGVDEESPEDRGAATL